ncbi:ferredoxin [Streptacidiphilus neutrinimicus]|uniref:ferredoxin n=1 Tax=Streptacidiphilus neutrinimicus TaxID=105420 RepID=UPI0005A75EB8|nr:ferredoxin [Streptacidiphilus neutrinimicus]
MRIRVNRTACLGAGQCVLAAPLVFAQRDTDATIVLLDAQPPPALHEAVATAADVCPNAVIEVLDGEGPRE